MARIARLHFAGGQLFDPDTAEVWAREVDELYGPRLAALPALADALEAAADAIASDVRYRDTHGDALIALRRAGWIR